MLHVVASALGHGPRWFGVVERVVGDGGQRRTGRWQFRSGRTPADTTSPLAKDFAKRPKAENQHGKQTQHLERAQEIATTKKG